MSPWLQITLGLVEIGLLVAAVLVTIDQFRKSRASSYIERFNGKDILESRIAVDDWLQKYATSTERLEALAADRQLLTQLRQFANLFQELGAAYEFGVADRHTVRLLFDSLVVMYWEKLRFFVYEYRAQTDPGLYSRFEHLYDEVRSRMKDADTRVQYVVAYGSLMDLDSMAAGLKRSVADDELIPIMLSGYRHAWTIGEQVRIGGADRPTTAVFLDVVLDPSREMRAVMFRVTREEMNRLIAREKNYRAEDVSQLVRLSRGHGLRPGASAWCFVGREPHLVHPGQDGVVILQRYLDRVIAAADGIDPGLGRIIEQSATDSGFPQVPGAYEFVDATQAELV